MNKEFTRMQKLAGVPVRELAEVLAADTTHEILSEGMEEKKKMTKMEAKQAIKDAILAELHYEDPADSPYDEMTDPHNLPGGQFLDEATPDATDRMDSLVSQDAKTMFFKAVSSFIRDLGMEGFEDDDIFDYIMDLVKTLPIMEESDHEDKSLGEAKKDEEEEVEDVEIEDTETVEEPAEDMIDADMEGGMDMDAGSDEAKNAFDELTDAYRSAKELGDEKLIRQLANTITYFNKNIILK